MGQKVSPIGFRTGVTIGWKSRWFAPKGTYGEFLIEDERIRRFIDERLNRQPPHAAVSEIEIERTREELKIILNTARPGLVIGPKGAEVDKLKEALEDLTNRRVNINIVEIRNPDLDARLVADGIAQQLKRRASFRRTIKQRAEGTMQAGAKGVKIMVSGRLGGAEMRRSEQLIMGSIPLHTLEADVDYGFAPCYTTYGTIGVKVWIYRGMFGEAPTEEEEEAAAAMTRARRRRERGRSTDRGPQAGEGGALPAPTVRPGGSRLGGRRRPAQPAKGKAQAAQEPSPPAAGGTDVPAEPAGEDSPPAPPADQTPSQGDSAPQEA
ncbi:MAG: 30S ribosomal protein S3 [Phycisphaerae bacterium]|nr:30S ribosomal protein S3 [Phycisphaerae bacterium]